MGYLLLLLFFLTWRESRKIRRAIYELAYENGRPPSKIKRLIELSESVFTERKEERRRKLKEKQLNNEKVQLNEPAEN